MFKHLMITFFGCGSLILISGCAYDLNQHHISKPQHITPTMVLYGNAGLMSHAQECQDLSIAMGETTHASWHEACLYMNSELPMSAVNMNKTRYGHGGENNEAFISRMKYACLAWQDYKNICLSH